MDWLFVKMSIDINLLPQKKNSILQGQQLLIRLKVVAVLAVCLTIASCIGVIILNQVNSPESLKTKQEQATTQFMQSQKKAQLYLLLLDRLNNIQNIISSRSRLENDLTLIQQQVPNGVRIEALSLDDKTLTMTVRSNDLTKIDTVITNMNSLLKSKKFISKLTIEDVVADQRTGLYSLAVDAKL